MKRFVLAFACLLPLLAPTTAQAKDGDEKDRKQFADWDKTVEGWRDHKGFLTLYRKEKKEDLLAAIDEDLLEQPFFLATSVSGGSNYAGWQWDDKLLRFERFDKQILLIELNTRQRAEADKPLGSVVKRTFEDRLLATLDIKSIGPDGQILVDLGNLLSGSYSTFFGSFSLRSSLARFSKVKSFPNNAEIAVRMPLYGDGTFMTLHYSISRLPALDDDTYVPRAADNRIGYFLTAIRDYTKGDPQQGRMIRLINRWQLEKADKTLKLSPPKEPIVFYVEKTVPIAYRQAVHAGILEWNRAFEKVGIQNAIVVRQQTDTQFADVDPEDVRFNFFRWITSEQAFAMGPSRVDPRTGRILDADIIFDDSMLRGYMRDYDILLREGPKKLMTRGMRHMLESDSSLHPLARQRRGVVSKERLAEVKQLLREATSESLPHPRGGKVATAVDLERLHGERASVCQVGQQLPQQVGMMRLALLSLGSTAKGGEGKGEKGDKEEEEVKVDEAFQRYLAQIVKETVMHEVGHTLGLRHNFKASSWLPLDKINGKDMPEAISASVMDYHPVNLPVPGSTHGNFLAQTVGPYDMLAIQYGYSLHEEGSDELKAIPREIAKQGLPYATDEDLGSPDPQILQWDLGKNPVDYAIARAALVQTLWKTLDKRVVQDNESYTRLRQAVDTTLFEVQYATLTVARQLGGVSFTRDHKGDPNERPAATVVPADEQRKALNWICDEILSGKSLAVPAELHDKLAASRWLDWSARGNPALEYSLLNRVSGIQSWALFFVTADDVLARTWENERRALRKDAKANPLTLPELFDRIEAVVFGNIKATANPSAANPVVSQQQQLLQDAYVRRLIQLSLGNGTSPAVANKLAWSRLQALETRFEGLLARIKLDPYTKSHFQTLAARSKQVRTAQYAHLASGGDALCSLEGPEGASGQRPIALFLLGLLSLVVLRRRVA